MKRIIGLVLKFPKSFFVISILITVILGSGIRKITIEEDIKEMMPDDISSMITLDKLEDIFGGSDVVVIAIGNEERTIFNRGTLSKIINITEDIESIPKVNKVTSLATIKHIKGTEWGLEVTPYLEYPPESEEDIKKMKDLFYEDSTYTGSIVSENGKYTSIIAVLQEDAHTSTVYNEIKKIKSKYENPEKIYLGGLPVQMTLASKGIKSDIRRLIPFVIIISVIILYLSFRTFSGVMLPLITSIMAVVSMIGAMGYLGRKFMIVNNTMPVILIAVGLAYGIHIIAGFYEEIYNQEQLNKKEALFNTLKKVGIPVLMAGLTTIAGFLSLASAPMPVIRELGAILSFGVLMAMFFSFTFIPAVLLYLPVRNKKQQGKPCGLLASFLRKYGAMIVKYRYLSLGMGAVLILLFCIGLPLVNIEMNPISFFPKLSEIRQADKVINENLGGSVNMNILFKGDMENDKQLKEIDKIQLHLEELPEVGVTMSLATVVKKINRSLHADKPEFEKIPESREAVAQSILLYNMSGSPEDYEQFVTGDYEYGQVTALIKSVSTKRISEIVRDLEKFNKNEIHVSDSVEITGLSVILKELAELAVSSQIRSLGIAIVLVFILALLTYRSYKIGFLAIIPITITIIANFGLMGFFGIALSIPTAMISSIIIGIGIDFSFHLISRFRLYLKNNNSKDSVVGAIESVGQPILFNAATTGLGFMVIGLSEFLPIKFMGILITLTMIVCSIVTLSVMAASLTFVKQKDTVKK